MKRLSKLPLGCAVTLACLGSLDAAAQATTTPPQQTQPQQSSAGHDMSAMDHAKMGHAPPSSQPARKTPPSAPATGAAKTQAAGHAGHGSAQTVPQPAASTTTQQHQADGQAGHAGHSDMPKAPATPPIPQPPSSQTGNMPGMDHSAMGHANPSPASAGKSGPRAHQMQMGPMQGGDPPPDARDPNAYNEGAPHANFGNHEMNDNAPFGKVLVDKAEAARGDGEHGQNFEVEAWYGNDYHKAWVKLEGERRGGGLEAARTELLWDRAFAPFWSTQLGMRHDSGKGGSRNWLAFGVQGLAPYWFETEATAYWRPGSGLAVRASVKYEVLFTSRLILEPELEANLYGRSDAERGTGKGLSDVSAGLRLRYEVTRKFAPYIGLTWSRQFGDTADYTRLRGGDPSEMQVVAGVRLWF